MVFETLSEKKKSKFSLKKKRFAIARQHNNQGKGIFILESIGLCPFDTR